MANQRYKIYKIENNLTACWTTPEAMQAWFDWIVKTKWWKERSKIKHVKVIFPVVGKMSGAFKEAPHLARIEFGVFSLCQQTACHELAHVLAWPGDDTTPEEDHGPKFVAMYLQVVKRFMSAEEAKLLQREFDDRGVKYTGGGI